ncbi:MAG: hypothetical protein WDZ30_00495 [Cellvibrionaceae bacterium]
MELSEKEIETIKQAETAVTRAKYVQPAIFAVLLSTIVLMAFNVIPRDDKFFFLLVVLMCSAPMLRPKHAPSYEELVNILSQRKPGADPLAEVLARQDRH